MTIKDQIISMLPKLNPKELGDIAVAVKALCAIDGLKNNVVPQGTEAADDKLLDAIAQCLIAQGLVDRSSHAAYHLTRRNAYQSYRPKRAEVGMFIIRLAESLGTRGNRYMPQICFLCAESLADLLKHRNILSPSTMLSQIDKIPEALDAAFPGYVESGLFGFLLLNAGKAGK